MRRVSDAPTQDRSRTQDAVIHAFTFRKGMLARLGHDLRLTLQHFTIELDAGQVSARFELDSFRVDGSIQGGTLASSTPNVGDKREIEATIARDILGTSTQPQATFEGTLAPSRAGLVRASGILHLRAIAKPIAFDLSLAKRARAVFDLVPSRWGIAPYKALGGALKLEDRVRIEVELTTAIAGVDPDSWQTARCTWHRQ